MRGALHDKGPYIFGCCAFLQGVGYSPDKSALVRRQQAGYVAALLAKVAPSHRNRLLHPSFRQCPWVRGSSVARTVAAVAEVAEGSLTQASVFAGFCSLGDSLLKSIEGCVSGCGMLQDVG
ncbi:hypothetical protein DUNSADRAFT_13590 [Dunaliella salina]|uniref:Encoded protein n=1 Tax=Dunaliella salina TaxID=3046 RepID=A0ABQ7H379_DUNSA|nr:hypothetical protein DUNSADRAFT_13590 [Dunaliella salina]|eukprot:KAF5841316.1 hypothetical protein DUNSADRAFT_13590 [Dunaliella salina]